MGRPRLVKKWGRRLRPQCRRRPLKHRLAAGVLQCRLPAQPSHSNLHEATATPCVRCRRRALVRRQRLACAVRRGRVCNPLDARGFELCEVASGCEH